MFEDHSLTPLSFFSKSNGGLAICYCLSCEIQHFEQDLRGFPVNRGLIFSIPATEIVWRESGPVEINGFLLATNDSSHNGELSIGRDIFLKLASLSSIGMF